HGRPDDLAAVMDLVGEATTEYLARQVEAGAEALMLFDSWAEGLPDNIFREVIIQPTKKLVSRLRARGVTVPIIGFPRGAGVMLPEYARETGVTAVGLDTAASPAFINAELADGFPVQGHLDPLLLIEGGARLDARVRELLDAYRGRPHIFNLGHGVRPETPIAHVERVLELIRTE
ncbi:MAG: uroporphyrinogen decarboxylase family protein, partial [Hyphomonas sp.]